MTLGESIQLLSNNPIWVIGYCLFIPVIILVLNFVVCKDEGEQEPWNYIYSVLIYLVMIPGIFALFFSVYLFLFERRSIMDTNLYIQVFPLLLMLVSIWLIRRNVDLRDLPGFGKLSGLIMTISLVIILMWIVDRTHFAIVAFTYMPIQYVILFFLGLLLLIRFGFKRLTS